MKKFSKEPPMIQRPRLTTGLFVACIGLMAAPVIQSCSPLGLAVGAGASVATASQTEKGLRQSAEDLRTRAEILHHLFQKNINLFSAVNVSVDKGRVLLTGGINNPRNRIEATKLAWRGTGVKEVINEIQVQDPSSVTDKAKDLLINKTLQARLLLNQEIKFINYSVDTVNSTVYLFGIAQNQAELERVVKLARSINYVENVVNYIILKK
jgi:osmotically-inducible protein OsmY